MGSSMKVALIFPRVREQMHGMWPPLGIITLGTILKAAGHEVSCLDSSFDPGPERVLLELARTRPAVVGVSCLTDFYPVASKLIAAAKAQGAVTVMGGPHPTIAPEDSLRCIPGLDYAVMGEAERTLPALLDCIAAGTEPVGLPGLGFRRGDEIVLTGPPEPIADLDSIPIPDRDLLDVHRQYLRARAVNLHASRGCPYRCRFCQPTLERLFGKKLRSQSPERVAEEIEHNHRKYGIRDFFFHDDTFTVNRRWLAGLVTALGARKLIEGFRYMVNSRVDTFDEERARLLKEMGVTYVLFGIESGAQAVLDAIGKGTTVEQSREAFRLCRRYGFRTHAYVLLGSPAETKATLAATEELVRELNPNTVHLSIFTPLLGTELQEQCLREGRIEARDFSDLDYYLKRSSTGRGPGKCAGIFWRITVGGTT
jgi:radical SAM superfamily enzyme YgiQ (UPF0313 family)